MEKLQSNRDHWNQAFKDFNGWCALPTWGPFEVGKNDNFIGVIKGKTFLEVCCGSGHSVKYLLDNGAKRVYALDFSEQQLALAQEINREYIEDGKAVFFLSAMEEKVVIPELVDTVFSIYGIGWTFDPLATFSNISSYLKTGGKFVWSWDHPIFLLSKLVGDDIVIMYEYGDESESSRPNRVFKDNVIYFTRRKVSTWHSYLRESGFEVEKFFEPNPVNLDEDISTISSPAMASYYHPLKAKKLPVAMIFSCMKK